MIPMIIMMEYKNLKMYIPHGIGNTGFSKTKIKSELPKLYSIGTTMEPMPNISAAIATFLFLFI